MEEIWKDIPDYTGMYQVSNMGRVKSLDRLDVLGRKIKGAILKPNYDEFNYLKVNLYKNRTVRHFKVHRLVAMAFIPNTDNKPEVDHINAVRDDNRVENLRWATRKENSNNPITRKHIKDCQNEPEMKKRNTERINKMWSDPLMRKKVSDSMKKFISDNPQKKEKLIEGLKKIQEKRKKPIVQLNKDFSFVRYWDCTSDAEKELGFHHSNINNCLKGRVNSANGYRWMYKDYYDIREQIRLGMDIRKGVA